MNMTTHVAINDGSVKASMQEYDLTELNEISARQLASIIGAQLVAWGEVQPGGAGLQANVKFIDSRSGDEINIPTVSGATPPELAAAIFSDFERSVEGIRQAAFCNDYLSSSQYDQALQNCESALAIVPTSSSALYGKATALLNLDRNEDALATYNQLLQVDQSHQDALLGAGLAASRLARSEDAMGYYRRYLEINPGSADVRMTVANDIAQTGDYVSAFRVLELGLADNTENTDFQSYLFQMGAAAGRALREAGDTAQAAQVLNVTVQAYEHAYGDAEEVDITVTQRVIEVLASVGRVDEALRIGDAALTRDPNNTALMSIYATALREAGRGEEEIAMLTRIIQAEPQHETAYIRRGQAHNRAGNRQQAIADLERHAAIDANTAAAVLYNFGATAAQAQNWPVAQSFLEVAFRHASGDTRSNVAYLLAASLVQQAQAINQANASVGNPQEFQRALTLVEQAEPYLAATTSPNAAQLRTGVTALKDYLTQVLQATRR
jgi:tetratricopeptide (TPR) repeat protein